MAPGGARPGGAAGPSPFILALAQHRRRPSPYASPVPPPVPVPVLSRATLVGAVARVRRRLPTYLVVLAVVLGGSAVVAVPLVVVLVDLALAAARVPALTHLNLVHVLTTPVSAVLLVVVAALVGVVVLAQQGAFLAVAGRVRDGVPVTVRGVVADVARASRALRGPQLLLFLLYAAVLVPVGGFGTAAFLVRGIAIPDFVIAELLKFPGGLAVYVAFVVVVLWLNLRLVLTLAYLLDGAPTVAGALGASWRATRGIMLRLLATFGAVALATLVVAGVVTALALVPTRVADARAPGASAIVAGASLAVVQVLAFLLVAVVAAVLAQVVVDVACSRRVASRLPDAARSPLATSSRPEDSGRAEPAPRASVHGPVRAVLAAGAVLGTVGLAAANTLAVSDLPDSVPGVVAHRGHPSAAVENSVPSLEAASALGVDYVELDVMQAADGGLVVFHDTTLRRLAGSGRAVADLTLAELTATTVRQGGHEATIPSLREFVERAKELDQPLLVELKLHGGETPDYVPDVVALLREEGVAQTYLVQAIYPELADAVQAAAPEIEVGYVVPFVRGVREVPDVGFLAVEQSSLDARTRAVARAAGVDLLVWTVNDAGALRTVFRDGQVDAVITSSPRTAVDVRDEVAAETGLAPRLEQRVRGALRW